MAQMILEGFNFDSTHLEQDIELMKKVLVTSPGNSTNDEHIFGYPEFSIARIFPHAKELKSTILDQFSRLNAPRKIDRREDIKL
jgi:hypothetical protein